MSGKEAGAALGILLIMAAVIGGAVGYVLNIVHIFHTSFTPFTGKLAVELLGVVIPVIGAIAGWLT